ncbi:hypothetical protein BI364_03625 [Acidihalobacter yilgarnensis]|uniref:Uncharacterized protein n=1 Tax=Acidihalobacter yilgarnensis TaxID=2819280 RepID=A0A1D8IL58_9GAMM|nr:VTT domain-containing protein [Acidihalobacter yilgarnensis]AOU97212.1 hypothetical protein BI364_03625 [Acidihalobacter yilgarnensis]
MHSWLQFVVSWVAAHPGLSGVVVFLIALGESLAVVGLLIPGTAVMFAIGALVAAGALNLWTTLAAAVAGAIIGDGLSYWLGYYYRDRVRGMWPFRTHPQWLRAAEGFIERHGGKSVLLGRFVGPVRPIVPVVAGMMRMAPRRFLLANVVSAVLWAPAYLAPGIGFGVAFDLFSRIALRLALLFGLLVAVLWLTGWAVHRLHRWLVPRAVATLALVAQQRARRPWLGRFAGLLIDPRSPDLGALATAALVLLVATWGLHALAEGTVWHQADAAIFRYLAQMRSPWGDHAMQWLSGFGSVPSLAALALWGGIWLAGRREWRLLLYWLGVSLLGMVLLALGMTAVLGQPARLSASSAWQVSLYGLIAMQVAQRLRGDLRWLPYSVVGLLLAGVGFARVYLGIEGLSGWLGGLLLGMIWVTLVGVACLTHAGAGGAVRGLLLGGIMASVAGLAIGYRVPPTSPPLAVITFNHQLTDAQWWHEGWRSLPALRRRLDGEPAEPLNIQWAGDRAVIEAFLGAHGWVAPPPLTPGDALNWLLPGRDNRRLPMLPRLNDGRGPVLVRIHSLDDDAVGTRELVLRLWPSTLRLSDGRPVWVGSLRQRRLVAPLGLLLLPRYGELATNGATWLEGAGVQTRVVHRQRSGVPSPVRLLRMTPSR